MSKFIANPDDPLPLYYQVFSSLRERIRADEFLPGDALPPERQLVKDYGVSRITIVKALDTLAKENLIERQQGRGTFVSQRVADNDTNNTLSIGYLPGGLLHPYFYSVQMGIARIVGQEGCYLHVIGSYDKERDKLDKLFDLITRSVDGVILYGRPHRRDMPLCERLLEANFPLVMVDRYYREINTDAVVFAEETAGYELTDLLIKRGHKRIAIMPHFEVNISSIRNRIGGYKRALEANGLPIDENLIWLDAYSDLRPSRGQSGDEQMTARISALINTCQPSAIVAVNDDVATRLVYDMMMINAERAHDAILQNGNKDYELGIELAAFTYGEPDQYGPFMVASGMQPGEIIGKEAARILIKRLRGELTAEPQIVRMPITISCRDDHVSS